MVSNGNAGKDDNTRADPHVVFDRDLCRGWRRLTPFDAVLVPVHYERVMTQETVAADLDVFVGRNR